MDPEHCYVLICTALFLLGKTCLKSATFVLNQKGGQNLKDEENFVYRKNGRVERNSKLRYICDKRDALNCPAVVVFDPERNLIVMTRNEHNHEPDLLRLNAR
jgi:hypothetical protein